jgi:hypothetical protein
MSLMVKVPEASEFRALYRRMDLATRSRLEWLARRGEMASDPEEAALVAAFAQRALRQNQWAVLLAGILLALNLLSVALAADAAVRWSSLAVVAVALLAIPVILLRHRPRLLRAQLRNRELAERGSRGDGDRSE